MAAIYLIRHGQASFGKENYDELSELGHEQATRLGEELVERLPKFDLAIIGSMQRHKQTAMGCLRQFDNSYDESNLRINAGWNEYDHAEILRLYRPEFETAASMMAFVRQQKDPKTFFEQSFNEAVSRWMSGEHNNDYSETWEQFKVRVNRARYKRPSRKPSLPII